MTINERATQPAGGQSQEETVWVTHPSPAALLPEMAISLLLIFALLPRAVGIVQFSMDMTHTVIPWTQWGAEMTLTLFRIAIFAPLLLTFIHAMALRLTRYELTTQRLKICRGLIVRRHDEIGLHRIRDYKVTRPVIGLFLGYGAVRLISRDPSVPVLDMRLIPNAKVKCDDIRNHAMQWKQVVGYKEFDTGSLS